MRYQSLRVRLLAEARTELLAMEPHERAAMQRALRKLEAIGERLGFPDTSAVRTAESTLRELRPRAGRSPWRAFYRRVGSTLVVAAIGPEATADHTGFRRAVRQAERRLEVIRADDFDQEDDQDLQP